MKFVNLFGVHSKIGSTTAHNEIFVIINTSIDYDMFKRRLNNCASYRLDNGINLLSKGLIE